MTALIPQIAVGIVLDQYGAGCADHLQKRLPRLQRHGGASRVLKIRSDHQELGALLAECAFELLQVDAVGPHANANHLRAGGEEQILHARIHRILDGNLISRPRQDALQQIQPLLASAGDDQIVARTHGAQPACLGHQVLS